MKMTDFIRRLARLTLPALLLIVGWPITAHADPVSISLTSILVSMAISAAVTAGSMLLTRLLTPKPKGQVTGKMQGELRLSDSAWGVAKREVYGHRFADGVGGVELGINVIWMNKEGIRKHTQVVQSSSGGGGKGPPKPPPETRITYDCDIACLVGKGPLRVLRIKFNEDVVYNVPATVGEATGLFDPDFDPEEPYDHYLLPDPYDLDLNPRLRHSLPIDPDPGDNSVGGTIVGGAYADIRIYEGNEDQEPDPVIQTDVDSIYGANSTPAFIGDCYFRLSGLSITKYNGFPNIVVLAEHTELHTIQEIVISRAVRVGLLESDFDLTVTSLTEVRGYAIPDMQAPKKDMEDFAAMYNFDFAETPDGKILAVDLTDRTITDTLDASELGAYVKDEGGKPPVDAVVTKVPNDTDMWKFVKVQFFNPEKDYQVDDRQDIYPFTDSQKMETFDFNATLLPAEATDIARRLLQMHWAGATPHEFTVIDRRIWLFPTNRILMPIAGETRAVRLAEMQGTAPGVLKCSGLFDELAVFVGGGLVPVPPAVNVVVSANTIATFLDIPLLHPQALPGFYIAACAKDLTGPGYVWPGAAAFRKKTDEFQQMTTFTAQCTIGRTMDVLPDVPADWADAREDFIRHFYAGTAAGGGGGDGALARMPDATFELEPWAERLRTSDPFTVAKQLGRALFLGPEYAARARTNVEFVTDLYSAYFDRDPDDPPDGDMTGRDYWVNQLDTEAKTRPGVIEAFEVSGEFVDHIADASAEFFDNTSSVSVDFFGAGEPSSVTDTEAREGANAYVIGNEATVIATWTRDMGAPNRWTGTHMLRRLKGTDEASDDHELHERVVLMNSAVRFVEIEVSEKGVARIWKLQTVGQRLEDCAELTVTWFGESITNAPVGVDSHVPILGAAAIINKDDAGPSWVIYTPKPSANGGTVTDVELFLYSDSDALPASLVRGNIPGNLSGRSVLAQTADSGYFRYRWRNQSQEDIGNGRGWSALSEVSLIAWGSASGRDNDLDSGQIVPVPIDPYDGGDIGCFAAGTLLRAPGGSQAIESFEVGTPIMVSDSGRLVESVVTEVEVKEKKVTRLITTDAGRTARMTPEQPIFNGAGFIFSERFLLKRDLVAFGATDELEPDRVKSVTDPQVITVYHLHVAHPAHNYVLDNGLIAHNIKREMFGP